MAHAPVTGVLPGPLFSRGGSQDCHSNAGGYGSGSSSSWLTWILLGVAVAAIAIVAKRMQG